MGIFIDAERKLMVQKRTKKLKSPDTDILPTQENARAGYEKLHNTEANDAIDDHMLEGY